VIYHSGTRARLFLSQADSRRYSSHLLGPYLSRERSSTARCVREILDRFQKEIFVIYTCHFQTKYFSLSVPQQQETECFLTRADRRPSPGCGQPIRLAGAFCSPAARLRGLPVVLEPVSTSRQVPCSVGGCLRRVELGRTLQRLVTFSEPLHQTMLAAAGYRKVRAHAANRHQQKPQSSREGLIYSYNLLLQLLHKLLLSSSFQWLRTSLDEPNTKLEGRKFN